MLKGLRSLPMSCSWHWMWRPCTPVFLMSRVSGRYALSSGNKTTIFGHLMSFFLNYFSLFWCITGSPSTAPTTSRYRAWPWAHVVPQPTPICTWGGWEWNIFSNEVLTSHTGHVLLWLRYIDDIFVIWTGSQQTLDTFVDLLNNNIYNLKFTVESNPSKIYFLDLLIFKDQDNCLAATLYRKETAGNTILHLSSAHPNILVRSIPYAQYIWLRRNCTRDSDFKYHADLLRGGLLQRGYSKSLLRKALNKAYQQSRNTLLYKTKMTPEGHSMVKFITQYSHQQHQLRNVLANTGIFYMRTPLWTSTLVIALRLSSKGQCLCVTDWLRVTMSLLMDKLSMNPWTGYL